MGINDLTQYVKRAALYKDVDAECLRDKCLAVDGNLIGTKYWFITHGDEQAWFDALHQQSQRLVTQFNTRTVWMFDGKEPAIKTDTISKRKRDDVLREQSAKRRLDEFDAAVNENDEDAGEARLLEERDKLRRQTIDRPTRAQFRNLAYLLDAHGVDVILCASEADPELAAHTIAGKSWAVLSNDLDMLVFGAERIITSFPGKTHCTMLMRADVLTHMDISGQALIDVCALIRNDYNAAWHAKGVGLKRALCRFKTAGCIDSLLPTNDAGRLAYEQVRAYFRTRTLPPIVAVTENATSQSVIADGVTTVESAPLAVDTTSEAVSPINAVSAMPLVSVADVHIMMTPLDDAAESPSQTAAPLEDALIAIPLDDTAVADLLTPLAVPADEATLPIHAETSTLDEVAGTSLVD